MDCPGIVEGQDVFHHPRELHAGNQHLPVDPLRSHRVVANSRIWYNTPTWVSWHAHECWVSKIKVCAKSWHPTSHQSQLGDWFKGSIVFGKMPWHFHDKWAYFRLQSLARICLHRMRLWRHNDVTSKQLNGRLWLFATRYFCWFCSLHDEIFLFIL